MKRHPLLAGLLLLPLCPASSGWSAQSPSGAAALVPVRRALLIGINSYASSDVPKLRGCVNDVEAMRLVLTGRFGFAPDNIRLLKDEAASRKGILAALDQLVEEARPEDVVFVQYAGHGSQSPDDDGDEPDGKDETLVPYDGRTQGVPDITDDELKQLLARLKAGTAVVVLDCCHSGTGTRSVAVRAREIEEDTRAELYRTKKVGTRAIVPLVSERYLLLAGAADRESALDGPIEGSYHGAFSYALTRTMAAAPAQSSARELFAGVEKEMRRLGEQWMISSMPEPQLEAPQRLLDSPLLPPAPTAAGQAEVPIPRLAWSEVAVDPNARRASIDAHALGAVSGARWELYPPGETAFAPGASKTLCEVEAVEGPRAYLKLVSEGAPIANGSRAVLSSPPPASDEISVHLRTASAEQSQALAAELRAALPGLKLAGEGEFALLYVEIDGATCRVLGSDGKALVATIQIAADERVAVKLAAVIERCLDTTALLALDNPSSRMQLELRLGAPGTRELAKVGQRGFRVIADNQAPVFHFMQGVRNAGNSLQISVRASSDCYLTIVDIDAEGSLNLLFPNEYSKAAFHPDGRITGGDWQQVPDSLAEPNDAGFHWDAAPPAGLDTIRVFASTDLAFAADLRDALRGEKQTATQPGDRGLDRADHVSRRARLARLRRSLASRGFKVVGEEAPKQAADAHAPAQSPAGNAADAVTPAGSDWTAASATARIEP